MADAAPQGQSGGASRARRLGRAGGGMPAKIRASGGGPRAEPQLCGFVALAGACLAAAAADAAEGSAGGPGVVDALIAALAALDGHEIAALALTLGTLAFAVLTAILLVRSRIGAAQADAAARAEITALKTGLDRAVTMLLSDPQVLVVWSAADDEPEILGDTGIVISVPVPRRVLAFGTWLAPDKAHELDRAVDALRGSGQSFSFDLTTLTGQHVEAEGRAIGGRAVLRLKDVSGAKHALAELHTTYSKLIADVDALRTLLEALPLPIWARESGGRLVWVNPAYAQAVEARDPADAVARELELLDRAAREDLERARAARSSYTGRIPTIVAGRRRVLDILDLPTRAGSAGIGIDATDVETMRTELSHMIEAHRRTLDQLSTAVATFAADQRLSFYNSAYRKLWGLDPAFLNQSPSDAAVLDQLRALRKVPEQTDFRQWRTELHEAYRALEPKEHWWHLPDGRTLRVVTAPSPEGGVTYVFDDVTERLDLERRHDALIRVQGETLDHLAEGVAVFGSDGRLRLHNPAFAQMWRLSPATLGERPHIEKLIDWCRLQGDAGLWQTLRTAATGLEAREPVTGRFERNDGSVLGCATVPLPDGGTLITFQDLTDTVNVERALRERNDALEAADELKNDFVHHVSYELRTPLTNIIGFTHLLHDDTTGPLSEKQREYLGYISSSSGALLAIINDILDLASIDAGAMKLDLGAVDIRRTIEEAADGVRDRLAEHELELDVRAADDIGSFTADERRVRQILFNLLSNAVAFSPSGEAITLTAERHAEAVVFSVIDRGCGISRDIVDRVFNRFESHAGGSQHRGAGLGLSIVRSFVELHGGTVTLDSAEGRGTTVTCVFPLELTARRVAAA
jgi:signal transduction histidine kinase